MSDTLLGRAVLAAALGLGVWAGLARAQGTSAAAPAQQPPQIIVVNGATYQLAPNQEPAAVPGTAASCPSCGVKPISPPLGGSPPNPPASADSWWAKKRRCGCWASINGFSCGSWESEAAFMFGSCRNFFGEPCAKGPPPPAYPGDSIPRNLLPNCKCAQP
jgi:hypothetical protein